MAHRDHSDPGLERAFGPKRTKVGLGLNGSAANDPNRSSAIKFAMTRRGLGFRRGLHAESEFLTLVTEALMTGPRAAGAQASKIYRLGSLTPGVPVGEKSPLGWRRLRLGQIMQR